MFEDQDKQKILIVGMVRLNKANKREKRADEIHKYLYLSYELQERRSGFMVKVVPRNIGCLGDGIKQQLLATCPMKRKELKNCEQNTKNCLMGKQINSLKSYVRTDKVNVLNIATKIC